MYYEEKNIVVLDFRRMEIPAIECVLVKYLGYIHASKQYVFVFNDVPS